MKKHFLFLYLRLLSFLALAGIVYLFWEWGGATAMLNALHSSRQVTAIRVGTPAPDITVEKDEIWSKKEFQLSSLKGYPIILHFWATWCGPCLQELPELLELAHKLRPEGYVFVAVAIDESWSVLESFFEQQPHLKPMLDRMIVILDADSSIAQKYKSSRFPETFLINSEFFIDNKFIGAQPWMDPQMDIYLNHLRVGAP